MNDRTRLQNLLGASLDSRPDALAIRFGSHDLSFTALDRDVRRLATGLRREGVRRGDRVALFLPNCPEAVMATLACYQLGAIAVPLNYRYLAPETRNVLERVEATLLIHHVDRAPVVATLGDTIEPARCFRVASAPEDSGTTPSAIAATSSAGRLFAHEPLAQPEELDEEDPALILFTSGSTGPPKGVVHTHGSAFAGIDISRRITEVDPHDTVLVGKPISHAGGLETQLMPTLLVGGAVVLAMKPTPAEAVSLIRSSSVTQYALMASDLLDFIEHLEQHPTRIDTLENGIGSGDVVPTELHHRFRDLFGWEVMEGCGMTELGTYYAMNPRHGERRWGSLGLPCPDMQIQILGDDGESARAGEVGEIALRSPASTIGYWKEASATEELLRDGWLHTGDLGHFDADGYLWLFGRKKLIIVRRGSNITPTEVENVIDLHPRVHASVVVGLPDARDGHVPVALVALTEGSERLDEDALRSFVSERLAAYKTPVRYVFLSELPRNSTGKFDRHRLEQIARDALGGSTSS